MFNFQRDLFLKSIHEDVKFYIIHRSACDVNTNTIFFD